MYVGLLFVLFLLWDILIVLLVFIAWIYDFKILCHFGVAILP